MTTPDDNQPMTAPDDNEGEASNGANETRQPDRRTHSKQRGRRKSRRQPTPSTRRATSNTPERNRPAAPTPTPRQAAGSSDPGRAQTETQTATAPSNLSNERGAKRYDDRAERTASRHDGRNGNARTRGTKASKAVKATTARGATGPRATWQARKKTSHEQPSNETPLDDAPPVMSKERGEQRDENGHAGLSNSFSSLIGPRDEASYSS